MTGPPGFGLPVSASDLNGDGFDDLLVSAATDSIGALLFFGGPAADSIPDLTVLRSPRMQTFGWSLAAGHDVNGDGYPDFAIANYFFDEKVCVYFGGPAMDGQPDAVLEAPVVYEFFGQSIDLAADINHDGIADLAVGAPYGTNFGGTPTYGFTYVYYGGNRLGPHPNLRLEVHPPSYFTYDSGLGINVAGVGDVNGDGMDDLLVVDHGLDLEAPQGHSSAWLFAGGNTPSALPSRGYGVSSANGSPLQSIAAAGDFNSDGIDDFVASAPAQPTPTSWTTGSAYIYFGTQNPSTYPTPDLVLSGEVGSSFGMNVFGGRDVNGDGFSDVLVGQRGFVFLYLGGPGPKAEPAMVIPYPSRNGEYEPHLAMMDWNGDGVADVIIGVPGNTYNRIPGHVYVYDVSEPILGRAFVRGERRTIPLSGPRGLTIQLQPVTGSFDNASLDPLSLRLVSSGTGAVSEITPVPGKTMIEQDTDHDGIPELTLTFAAQDVAQLFDSVRGRQEIEASVEGHLLSGRPMRAPISLTIAGTGGPSVPKTRLSPNPLNPNGVLEFMMVTPGRVTLRLYDVTGRCVRILLQDETYDRGSQRIQFAARDDDGKTLASGVYFYRLELPEGVQRGRFVVAK